MIAKYLRIATFLAVALLATGLSAQDDVYNTDFGIGPAGGAGGSCQTCVSGGQGSSASMGCVSAQSGDWGETNCRIERDGPNIAYCLTDGYACCVD
jgi:hypothetical protein